MTIDARQRVLQLYHQALGRDLEQREDFVREACDGDADLCREVEALLAHDPPSDFLTSPTASPRIPTVALAPGTRLGPYEVVSQIGVGGMGEVYRARDNRLGRDVAIKVLPAELAADENRKARLLREARAAASLSHPHICAIYDVGEAGGHAYVAMELVEGQSLKSRLETRAMAPDEVVRVGAQLAGALAHAHAHGVVHRDFKSANVMLTASGDVKVVDFGLAKRMVGSEMTEATMTAPASLTQPGMIVGTLAYMSPEQFRGEPADARCDVWALGVVLYEMATGQRPFTGRTGFALSAAVANDVPSPLPSPMPAVLQAVVARCLEKEPARRYQHGGEVRTALELVPVVVASAQPAWRGRRGLSMGVAAAAVVALAILAILQSTRSAARPAATKGSETAAVPMIRLAVVPFENLTGDPGQDYFSDGLTEEMIAQLGRLAPQRLQVIARTSVMRYKGSQTAVDQIGRELGVDYVLEGSARRDAAHVRVTAQLVQVREQVQLWAETYERDLADILALQSDVSQRVARGLALQLLPVDQRKTEPVDPEAYDLYLQGRAQLNSGPLALDRAQQLFERALRKNPKDALSHAGISEIWRWRAVVQAVPGKEATARQKEAALKAVELDDRVAESHVALGGAYLAEWDWARAEAEYKRALELNPNHATAHAYYGGMLAFAQRFEESATQMDWATALDPLNGLIRLTRGTTLVAAGRFDDAIRELRSGLASAPGVYQFHWVLWRTLHARGNDQEALAELIALSRASGQIDEEAQLLQQGGGYREVMRRVAAFLEIQAKTRRPLNPTYLALLHHDAGNRERAFDWMEQALEDGDRNLIALGVLAPDLKEDPRFRSLMQRIGLPY